MQLFPSFERFGELAADSGVVLVYEEFLFGVENAVTAYAKLAEPPFGFLLESVAGANNGLVTPFLKHDPVPGGLPCVHGYRAGLDKAWTFFGVASMVEDPGS